MENKKLLKVVKEIHSILETTPGIIGFVSLLEGISRDKSETNWIKIEDTKKNGNLEISIGIIINRNVTSKNLSNEIFESINFHFKNQKNNLVLKKLNVYIKGVK